MATRWKELKDWGGKTALGTPFYGQNYFNQFLGNLGGDLEKPENKASSVAIVKSKNLAILFISGRPGSSDVVTRSVVKKERSESNTKFMHGTKTDASPDFQLFVQTMREGGISVGGRTSYIVSCKHHEINVTEPKKIPGPPGSHLGEGGTAIVMEGNPIDMDEFSKSKCAGECRPCLDSAIQRLHAVAQGLYSISLTEIIPKYGYAARYVGKDGVIVQDIFKCYSKPDITQVLQILMSNPADLHPLAVAEDQNLYWPIIWYWGSVFSALQEATDFSTLEAVYGRLGRKITILKTAPTSALAAFPENAAGEWRVACGNENCPRVDHEVKFNLCKRCKVRRYCNEVCQRGDWPKHKKFCKAGKGDASQVGNTARLAKEMPLK